MWRFHKALNAVKEVVTGVVEEVVVEDPKVEEVPSVEEPKVEEQVPVE
tara:strand:- start:519 stop:662 length:144 start_codon:yes stop_codon:yes gene_type:complete